MTLVLSKIAMLRKSRRALFMKNLRSWTSLVQATNKKAKPSPKEAKCKPIRHGR
jgi:hypothetical protein